jgi:hypothetical protein
MDIIRWANFVTVEEKTAVILNNNNQLKFKRETDEKNENKGKIIYIVINTLSKIGQ